MDNPSPCTLALHEGAWLPCHVLQEDPQTGTLAVRLTGRGSVPELWLRAEQVRGFARGSLRSTRTRRADAAQAVVAGRKSRFG